MNKQTNEILASLVKQFDARPSKKAHWEAVAGKCAECGCKLTTMENVKQQDGKMLCEECWGDMKGESVQSDDTFMFYEWKGGENFVEKKEKGPVVARVKSDSDPEKEYEIRLGADGNFYCSCPAWKYQKKPVKDRMCKHIEKWAKAHDMKLGEGDEIRFADEVMVLEMSPAYVATLVQEATKYEKLVGELEKKGAEDPKALAAFIGRKKLGKAEFQRRAAAGRAGK